MATIGKQAAEAIGYWGMPNVQPEIRQGPEGASQTYTRGAFLKWSSGLLVVAVADDNALAGIAVEAGKNLASGGIARYTPMTANLLIKMTFLTGAAADYVSLVTDRGSKFGFQITSNLFVLDKSEVTNGLFRIVAFPGTDYGYTIDGVIGDTNVRALVVPVAATTAFG